MDRPASPVVDYLLPPQDEALAQGSSRTVVLVVDTTLDNTDTLGVQECIRTATEALQPEWRVALVTFGASLRQGPPSAIDTCFVLGAFPTPLWAHLVEAFPPPLYHHHSHDAVPLRFTHSCVLCLTPLLGRAPGVQYP